MKRDYRTAVGRARGFGSAHEGTSHFWLQHLTSLVNVPLLVFFIILVMSLIGKDYDFIHARLSHPVVAVFMGLMVFSNLYYMKLEMQLVIEDYIPHKNTRAFFLILNVAYCFIMGGFTIFALSKIALGG
ncbi:succinate dehydrogenase, hydrophobic membrane anchor protein [Bartonella ancashensis]|uniref:Succinate dehydrogenase hydrophobic membrane anchor subunit n=1 Tax=Bartonella ancashensis TaxID=1318743 RepID=A0A0M4LFX0_9HYPH|nr:succinate dehydrogenase, hydrophobic membrane anchor protein [Bartonella ancashensis]ALE03182.1 Succinate dehydrogenase hydrophobic membrane anchor protein [Bartonella ancashensis]